MGGILKRVFSPSATDLTSTQDSEKSDTQNKLTENSDTSQIKSKSLRKKVRKIINSLINLKFL